ncbi:TetR/AcrR family transcriptional regulator [Agromyces sp. SYSU K20354]|uniref:TetR/AcrR family transcriptional regulator n=1 Tax=Agromyces cavernae TaxID=2898659 RepID=UPI001E52C300|nr:TetR/AcrR family transcriptional regulator [Agromyces cavernae]MCD2443631.1 TetR/AcrR family transcriptional regulator [Agromyces cavernae]
MTERMTAAASATTASAASAAASTDPAAPTGAPGRAALLRAIEELAREQGVANVGLREVARRAGLSHAAPTHFFGSREGMIRALALEGLAMLDDELCTAQERAAHLPGRERLVADSLEFVGYALRHPAHYDAMFRTPSSAQGDPALDAARLAALDGLRALVIDVHDRGEITGDVETTFLQLCAMSHGIASLAVDGLLHDFGGLARVDDVAERIIRAQVEQLP